ncbi:2,3-bisphosphoglycerate-independent phosphoglycerate mutase [Baaleninema sp.]|uniref:2,3-bisphosphoglycerate-independent phosphoglycerate mutase n=1 Tax=Baaleninema sp. TaxID=3101197 RepID=UPI003CFF8FDB
MDISTVWEKLVWNRGGKIIDLVLDGVGGLPDPDRGATELQVAETPNLDRFAENASCGQLEIVGPGITPGSGPGHLALFGYDPLQQDIGRGVLSALGSDFDLQPNDIATRVNFATVDEEGRVVDRRAGRIDTDTNRRLCKKIRDRVQLEEFDGTFFFQTVSEHRAVFVLRGQGLDGELTDTDPQTTGTPPNPPQPRNEASRKTAKVVQWFLEKVGEVLAEEHPANAVLLRGFQRYDPLPSLRDRFGLRGLCVADYPMYRGVSRLLGMDVVPRPGGMKERFEALRSNYGDDYDFYFLHVKHSDSRGEDENFDGKVKVIEAVDGLLPHLTDLGADTVAITADHSTPAVLGGHSWHPVPLAIQAKSARVDGVSRFDEYACAQGILGTRPGLHLMGLVLAHAGRLQKFGA